MRSRKIIKKILQITALLLFLAFALPATAFLLLQSSRIQAFAVKKVTALVTDNLQTRFSVGSIDMAFLYRIRLNEVYLEDVHGDTLGYAGSVTVGIRRINPLKRQITIRSVNFDKAYLSLYIDSTHTVNLNYLLDRLKGDGKGEGGWKVKFNNLRVRNSRFSLRSFDAEPVAYGVNYSDMRLTDINGDVRHFNPGKDSLSFDIRSFQFREQSGFVLHRLSGKFSEARTFLKLYDFRAETPHSSMKGRALTLKFTDYDAFKAGSFVQQVRMLADLDPSVIDFYDIGFFAPAFQETHQEVTVSGIARGTVSNLKTKKLEIRFGEGSVVRGEINMEGLPDFRSTFILADIRELSTQAEDLRAFHLPGGKTLRIPEQVYKLGRISYTGKYTGFIDDFVAFGKFSTRLGTLSTDLLFRPDTARTIDFEGKLRATDFDLGTLLNARDNIGRISLSVSVSGVSAAGGSINADLKGNVQRFEFRGYNYSNIALAGHLKDNTYDGSVNIRDPNISLEFLGEVNLAGEKAAFDFTANVTDANLYALNLDRSDPDFTASFYLIAKGKGNSVNNLNGEIRLLNSLFTRKDQQLQVYDCSIVADDRQNLNHLQVRSDFLDADLSGHYLLTQAGKTFRSFLQAYLPSLSDSTGTDNHLSTADFNLKATVKNARPLLDFFLPGWYVADKSTLNCTFRGSENALALTVQSPQLQLGALRWTNLAVSANSSPEALVLEACSKYLSMGSLRLENLSVSSASAHDSSRIGVKWNNWQDLLDRGDIRAVANFSRQGGSYTRTVIDLLHAGVVTRDSAWTVSPGRITLDTTRVEVGNLRVSHDDQYFTLGGVLSENPDDNMSLIFDHFNLANLNGLLKSSGFSLGGELNGKASISDFYRNSLFTSQMNIDSLTINKEILGNSTILSSWDDRRKAIQVEAYTMRENLKTLKVNGSYVPAGEGKLNFSLELDKLRMNLFNPYLKNIFSDLRGIASGKIQLTGSPKKPVMNGEISMQKTAFTVDYLKTRYNFTEKLEVENNNVYFDNVRVFDQKGNSAYLTGAIRNKYLKDFLFDLTLRSTDFLCLNTSAGDNSMFYGTAYATGVVRITGPPKNLTMDITATTGKNTSIKIPLSTEGKVSEYNFITVVKTDTSSVYEEEPENRYQVNLSGMQINFDLTVTPESEVQIIFDPKLGDIIRGRGSGNLDMKINTAGSFLMYGDYVIEEGDYLFTLQNFINKKFNIESGGRIRWNGDPFDATIDVVANYRTKASLGDLRPTLSSEQQNKIMVDDRLTMTGKLMKPDVKYDINLPNASETDRLTVANAISSSEELNKQFISLLVQNRFVPSSSMGSSGSSSAYSNVAGVNASEFLSNQLSHWLSQINNDLDVGINYRSNRELKADGSNRSLRSDEIQVVLSTQLFNDKLTINGSVDVATNAAVYASDNIVGEFDIDYKITKNGKFRVKTFNHTNNEMLYEYSPYTQGLGIFYKEEFNSLGELWHRYWQSITGTREKKSEVPPPDETQPGS